MRPLVSVVIPAHNPGRYIEPCIRSILRQTMRPDRFEAIFVDDGSTDGTADRLNRLASEHQHIRVIHIPASGAPGRPRNVGLETARGEYVQFLDADDELAPRGLERLYRMAWQNGSDIVLGKFASETMTRRQDLFRRNRPRGTLEDTPGLVDASMGPTKLFRAALLRDHDISFPEGWRQMEDQLFTLRAYLVAKVISVVGDEPCYFFNKREDEGHISTEHLEPVSHAEHLAEILDVVETGVRDPSLRRRLTARFYRTEVLARLTGERFIESPVGYQAALFDALRGVAVGRIDADVHASLGAIARVRSRLLREGDLEGLLAFGRRVDTFALEARVARATWAKGRLLLEYGAALTRGADASPLTLLVRGDRTFLDPVVADDLVGPIDVTDELGSIKAQLALVDSATSLEWIVPGRATLTLRPVDTARPGIHEPCLQGFVHLDPQGVGPGSRPLDDGSWDVIVRILGLGLRAAGPLRAPRGDGAESRPFVRPALLGEPPRWFVASADAEGRLRIGVGGPDRAPAAIEGRALRVLRDGDSLSIALAVVTDRSGAVATGRLRLTGRTGTFSMPATFRGEMAELVVTTPPARGQSIPRGRYELAAYVGTDDAAGLAVGAAHVRDDGRIVVLGTAREPALARLARWARWYGDMARDNVARLRAVVRSRLVKPARQAIRTATSRARD